MVTKIFHEISMRSSLPGALNANGVGKNCVFD